MPEQATNRDRILHSRWCIIDDSWTPWFEVPPERCDLHVRRAAQYPDKYEVRWMVPERPAMPAPTFTVEQKGAVITTRPARLPYSEVQAVCIDLTSKYADVYTIGADDDGTGSVPIVHLFANERTIKLNEKVSRDAQTVLRFDDYKGWTIISATVTKYTLTVVFGKYDLSE